MSCTIIEELADDLEMQRHETDSLRRAYADDLEMQRHETDTLRRAYADAVADLRDMECRLDTANRRIRQAKNTYLDLQERHEDLKRDHSDLQEELADLSRDYRSVREDCFELEERLSKRSRREPR